MDIFEFSFTLKKDPFHRPCSENIYLASVPSSLGLKALIAGGIVGALESFLSYPAELAKTKLQLDKSNKQKKFFGVYDVLKTTVNEKGFSGLYRGFSVILFFSIPKIAIRFSTFEFLKSYVVDESGNMTSMMRLGCGLGAGISEAVFVVTPMDTVKVKFIQDHQKKVPDYRGLFHGIKTIFLQEGITGLYQGLIVTIVRQGSNQAIRFYVMETLKQDYRKGDPNVVIPKTMIGIFGIIAATISVYANTPVDVIKTRMQGLQIDAEKYEGSIDCAKQIWKNEGFRGFYKGTRARLIRVCIDVGFTFMVYETVMEKINKLWP